ILLSWSSPYSRSLLTMRTPSRNLLRRFLDSFTTPSQPRRRPRLRLETLEDRLAPATGWLDGSFNRSGRTTVDFSGLPVGATSEAAVDTAVQADGKVVVVGNLTYDQGNYDVIVLRYNSDGTPDPTFNGVGFAGIRFDLGGTNSDRASHVAVDSSGRIVVA